MSLDIAGAICTRGTGDWLPASDSASEPTTSKVIFMPAVVFMHRLNGLSG